MLFLLNDLFLKKIFFLIFLLYLPAACLVMSHSHQNIYKLLSFQISFHNLSRGRACPFNNKKTLLKSLYLKANMNHLSNTYI